MYGLTTTTRRTSLGMIGTIRTRRSIDPKKFMSSLVAILAARLPVRRLAVYPVSLCFPQVSFFILEHSIVGCLLRWTLIF